MSYFVFANRFPTELSHRPERSVGMPSGPWKMVGSAGAGSHKNFNLKADGIMINVGRHIGFS